MTLYVVNLVIHMVFPEGHFWRSPSLAMCCDTISDVIAKVIYNKIITEAHTTVFSSDVRTMRQLNELKQLMSVLWVSSSDVIVIATHHEDGRSTTILSPSFFDLVGANSITEIARHREPNSVALVVELEGSLDPHQKLKPRAAYYVDTNFSGDVYRDQIEQTVLGVEDLSAHVVHQVCKLVRALFSVTHI